MAIKSPENVHTPRTGIDLHVLYQAVISTLNARGKGVTMVENAKDGKDQEPMKLTTEVLEAEIKGVKERLTAHDERLRQAKRIIILVGCDDGRVGVPDVMEKDEQGRDTFFIYIPKIGGGAPSREVIADVMDHLKVALGDAFETEDIELIVTQHGSSEEVQHTLEGNHDKADTCISCGLRKVFSGHEDELAQIGEHLRMSDHEFSFTEFLKAQDMINLLHKETTIPRRLIFIAAKYNFSPNMGENADGAAKRIAEYGLIDPSKIFAGYYDHNAKNIHVVSEDDTVLEKFDLNLPEWPHAHQDPSLFVISYGPLANAVHDGVFLPDSVGIEQVDNDFSSGATNDVLDALAETWYAANTHAEFKRGHGHGDNFKSPDGCVILCDNEEYVEKARQAVASDEFKSDMLEAYKALGAIFIVNLETEKVEKIELN